MDILYRGILYGSHKTFSGMTIYHIKKNLCWQNEMEIQVQQEKGTT